MRPLRVLTWHVHGNYLYYLSHAGHEFYLPVVRGGMRATAGAATASPRRTTSTTCRPRPCDLDFDCILFQSRRNYCEDQYEILSGHSSGCRGSTSSTTRPASIRPTRGTRLTIPTSCSSTSRTSTT